MTAKKVFKFRDVVKTERKDWGLINPVSKVVQDKVKEKNRKACRGKVNF
jgi:hypothetical protein